MDELLFFFLIGKSGVDELLCVSFPTLYALAISDNV